MSVITIRLPEELRVRVARAAEAASTTAHGFILEAIAEKVEEAEQAEQHTYFHSQAEGRWVEFLETSESISWEDARRYLADRSRGQSSRLPLARKFAK